MLPQQPVSSILQPACTGCYMCHLQPWLLAASSFNDTSCAKLTPLWYSLLGDFSQRWEGGAEIPLRWSFGPINCSGPTHLPFQLHSYCSAFHAEMLQQLRHAGFGSPTHPPGTVAQSSFLHGGGCCHSSLFHRFCSQPVLVAICVICNLDCWLHHLLTTPVVPS